MRHSFLMKVEKYHFCYECCFFGPPGIYFLMESPFNSKHFLRREGIPAMSLSWISGENSFQASISCFLTLLGLLRTPLNPVWFAKLPRHFQYY